MNMICRNDKLRAVLRTWAPEVYDAASREGRVWLSLWDGDRPLRGKRFESAVSLEVSPTSARIFFDPVPSWKIRKLPQGQLRVGISVGHPHNDPVHFSDAPVPVGLRRNDILHVTLNLSVGLT